MFFNVTHARQLCKKNTQDNQASFIAIVQKNRHQAIKWLLISKALTVLSSTSTSALWDNFGYRISFRKHGGRILEWVEDLSTIWQKILRWMHVTRFCVEEQKRFKHKIKGLFEPAHSCYGLSLHWFLGLAEYKYSWIWFIWTFKTFGIYFLLFLGSCVLRKLVHSSWWELEKRLCGLEVGWAEVIRQIVSFLLVCVCVFVGRRVGWVGMIRHQMLLW